MERLLAEDGLTKLPLVVVSARTGDGIAELRRLLAQRVAARDAALAKLAADLERGRQAAGRELHGQGRPASAARTARSSWPRSRRPPAYPRSCVQSETPTGAAVRWRPAGRSSAGCAASGPTR